MSHNNSKPTDSVLCVQCQYIASDDNNLSSYRKTKEWIPLTVSLRAFVILHLLSEAKLARLINEVCLTMRGKTIGRLKISKE